jgi:hypothetical protein
MTPRGRCPREPRRAAPARGAGEARRPLKPATARSPTSKRSPRRRVSTASSVTTGARRWRRSTRSTRCGRPGWRRATGKDGCTSDDRPARTGASRQSWRLAGAEGPGAARVLPPAARAVRAVWQRDARDARRPNRLLHVLRWRASRLSGSRRRLAVERNQRDSLCRCQHYKSDHFQSGPTTFQLGRSVPGAGFRFTACTLCDCARWARKQQ